MAYEQLKLENQLCFPLYASSHLITRRYKPFLDELGITYPQYLVLMVLWEHGGMPVNTISKKLLLNTNTVTPLLKRMEAQGLLTRKRSKDDERRVEVRLSAKGRKLETVAAKIPEKLAKGFVPDVLSMEEVNLLKSLLHKLTDHLQDA